MKLRADIAEDGTVTVEKVQENTHTGKRTHMAVLPINKQSNKNAELAAILRSLADRVDAEEEPMEASYEASNELADASDFRVNRRRERHVIVLKF